jgi:hypothetical protein
LPHFQSLPVKISALVLCIVAAFSTASFAGEQPAAIVLDPLLVSGEQPGPGLWKVAKGDHVLWIVGIQSPVPKKMTWRSKKVEAIIAESQEILGRPGVSISAGKGIGYFSAIFLLPSAMEARKNPKGATLRDVLPADLYVRWEALRNKYVGDYNNDAEADIERWRPMFAAYELYGKAIDKSGLTSANPVERVIREAAKKHGVTITDTFLEPTITEPRAAINQLKSTPLADLDCFIKTVNSVETDIEAMRKRGNAWATGDLTAIRALPAADLGGACAAVVREATFVKTAGLENLEARVQEKWLAAADAALSKNRVTLATLSMEQLFRPDGYLAKLTARGYRVVAPESD